MTSVLDEGGLRARLQQIGRDARRASLRLASFSAEEKSRILHTIADGLDSDRNLIQSENHIDVEEARKNGISEALVDRLTLNDQRYRAMVQGVRDIASSTDPIGEDIEESVRPNGLRLVKRRVPIGTIAIIFESRPNVTVDAAALCVRTSNAVILRGGSEAFRTNKALIDSMCRAARVAGLPDNVISFVDSVERRAVEHLIQLEESVDLVIPRGGESLIRYVAEHARVPVLKHYKGVCHTYVDASADIESSISICINAKCQRPGVCNATETILVHKEISERFLPRLIEKFLDRGVEIRGDEAVREICPAVLIAEEEDWNAEYLALIVSIKVVDSLDSAIAHINEYGSRHTDAILSDDESAQERFSVEVDTGVVVINASTRFNDGSEFGMGAEMGISTDKLHARGPVGARELTTYKYIVTGSGQIRE
jgi:glutamate-5-semialdehyde dehydrogenase